MKIAIVGTGISGMVAAYLLCKHHDITVFEASDYIGGHTHTVDIPMDGQTFSVDTGFIVYNDRTYPNFVNLLGRLGVETQESEMSFSVRCEKTGFEYNGTSLNSLFAQRRNLIRPSFYRMIRDILRFNRESPKVIEESAPDQSLSEYLAKNRYSKEFVEHYIIPMGSAIWSANSGQMERFPVRYFVQFFKNHGMLSVDGRPMWRTVKGGSCRYVEALTRPYSDRIRLNTPVRSIARSGASVTVRSDGVEEIFDQVILATHSDQALAVLADATRCEREILGAFFYQENDAALHTDISFLPRRRLAWAGWNYHILRGEIGRVAVTYNMNILQRLRSSRPFCVTLNRTAEINPANLLRRFTYHHPVYTPAAVEAQKSHGRISGVARTHFCGAYWGYGFHEDGVKSALAVCKSFGVGFQT